MACVEALRGIPLHIVTRQQHVQGVNRFWMSVRAKFGMGFVPPKNSVFHIHRLLKQGKAVAMVIDQHMPPGRGIGVPFFGKLASTTYAPALMAFTTGAQILPVSIERIRRGRHRVCIEAPVEVKRDGDRTKEVLRLTSALNKWLEEKIIQNPDQWLWIHRRWKPVLSNPLSLFENQANSPDGIDI